MMTLTEALNQSDIEVAETWHDGYTIVVGSDDDNGGYDVSFKVGDMPPHRTEHVGTVEEAEQVVGASYEWEPREGEY